MKIRVLLADDHAMMRDGLRALLTARGDIDVVADVANGREAVRTARELRPDVVIMDLGMPEMNGIDATQQLQERCPQVRVVILSMHSSSEHVFRAFQAGASAYVLKEAAASEMEAAVRAVHAGQSYLSRALEPPQPMHGAKSPIEALSRRERQVLQLVVEGYSSADIATRVHLSPKTVETYRVRVMRKLGVKDFPALVRFALKTGLSPIDR
jgi:DNA-binding NarL/FixJ family response regulator